jgi:hypothetical protein
MDDGGQVSKPPPLTKRRRKAILNSIKISYFLFSEFMVGLETDINSALITHYLRQENT